LRVEDNKSGSTFYNKFDNAVLLATSNLWSNIQIVRTHILKHDISNPISLTTRYLDSDILHHYFGHTFDEVICHVFDNIEDINKINFPTQNISTIVVLLERYTNAVSLRILLAPVSL